MAPFVTPPRKPRTHALSLAESLLGPRARTLDADRVGLDPLLRSHLHSMSEGIDGLLRRTEPVPTLYDSQSQADKVQRGAQELHHGSPPRLADLPPGAPQHGLVHSLISGLATEDVSVSDAVGTLESDLRSPNVMTAPGRLGYADDDKKASQWGRDKVLECDRCAVMALQVRALAQSLAGLSAKIFNWSSMLKPALRRQLSDMVLQYTLPCAHIDESIQHLCDELSSTRWDNTVDVDDTKKRRISRSSATWHWWDSDPANLGLTSNEAKEVSKEDLHHAEEEPHHAEKKTQKKEGFLGRAKHGMAHMLHLDGEEQDSGHANGERHHAKGEPRHVKEEPHHAEKKPQKKEGFLGRAKHMLHLDGGEQEREEAAKKIQSVERGRQARRQIKLQKEHRGAFEDQSSIEHVSSPKAFGKSGPSSTASLTANERVVVNVIGLDGAKGSLQLQLVLYDRANDDDAVVAASSRVEVRKNQVTSVEMFPDMTVEQNGVAYPDMEDPCYAVALDQAATSNLVLDEEDMTEVDLGEAVDIAVRAKKKGLFWNRK